MMWRGRIRAGVGGLAAVVVLALTACSAGVEVGGPEGERLLLDEQFTGGALARDRWGTCHWWAPDGCTIATNDELEWYLPGQVTVADGALHLTARPGPVVVDGERFPYVSGMISSGRPGDEPDDRARLAFTYGRVEVRFRIPRGEGLWPAIWMLPVTNEALPEVDLLEVHGDAPRRAAFTFHQSDGGRQRREVTGPDLSLGWHTIALDWSPGRLRWAVDGVVTFTVEGDEVPDEPMYLVANLAVGGDAGDPGPETSFPATFLVDSITVRARP